jgi:hypothetical protein
VTAGIVSGRFPTERVKYGIESHHDGGGVSRLKSLVLSIGWLLGELVFWYIFPARIDKVGRESQATTVLDILTYKLSGSGGIDSVLRSGRRNLCCCSVAADGIGFVSL